MKPRTASHVVLLQIHSLAVMALAVAFNPGSACAQPPSQGPIVIKSQVAVPSLDARALGFGANGIVETVSLIKEPLFSDTYYGVGTGRDTFNAPRRAQAFWHNPTTLTTTLVTDVDGITKDGDLAASCDPSLKVLTMWTAMAGVQYSTRNSPTGPWGPLAPVTGISPLSFTAVPALVEGKLHLMWDDERNNLSIGEFNSTTGAVTNARTLVTNPSNLPSFFCHSPTPQNDDQGWMQGLAFTVRQRGLFNSSAICTTHRLDDKGPKHKVLEDTALYHPGGFIGGSLISSRLRLAASPTDATVRLDLGNTSCAGIPAAGGRASLFIWGPHKNPVNTPWAAFMMLGVLRHAGIEVPGVNGKIYIDPAVLVLLPMLFLPQTTGFSHYDLMTPPVQRDFSLPMQPVFFDQSGTDVGNLAWISAT
jgi:hypothetical protein